MKTALIFSGQGSQYVGMLKDISERYPQAASQIKNADDILGFNLSTICFEGPEEELKKTIYTQPALFLHSAVNFDLTKDKLPFEAVAGHSVGEYAALYAAGVLSFEEALKLVALRGKLMFEVGNVYQGTMFALIGADDAKAEVVCNELNVEGDMSKTCVPANYNSPGQLVISGSADYLRENTAAFKQAGAKIVKELVVSGAFHSPLMQPAKEELEKAINNLSFANARVPLYSNVYAKPLIEGEAIKEALIKQLTSPVKWTQSIQTMVEDGIAKFIEIGPNNVLQGLVKRIAKDVEISGIDKVESVESFII